MKKIFLVLVFGIFSYCVQAQVIHAGIMTFEPVINLSTEAHSEYIYYFSNIQNETVKYLVTDSSTAQVADDYYPRPGIFVRFDTRGNLFYQFDCSLLWFKTKNIFQNSVDPSQFINVSSTGSGQYTTDYNVVEAQWRIIRSSFSAGYRFFKSKALRPVLYTGFSIWGLTGFEPTNYDKNSRQNRHMLLFRNLDTFKPVTGYFKIGAGIHYKALAINAQYEISMGEVDRNSDMEMNDMSLTGIKNYRKMECFSLSMSYNLWSMNITKADRKVKPTM